MRRLSWPTERSSIHRPMRQMSRANALQYEWHRHVVRACTRARVCALVRACVDAWMRTCVAVCRCPLELSKLGRAAPNSDKPAVRTMAMHEFEVLAGRKTREQKCPSGYYCPTPLERVRCPRGYYCMEGTHDFTKFKCPLLAACPPGTAIPTSIALFAVLAMIVIGLVVLLAALQYLLTRRRAAQTAERRSKRNIAVQLRKLLGRPETRDFSGFTKKLCPISLGLPIYFEQLFGACRRRTPRARSNQRAASERSRQDASLSTLQIDTGPRRFAVGMLRDVKKTHSAEFDNVGFTLAQSAKVVLDGVTGKFDHSQLIAIMGPSGSGKTSLLNVLCGKAYYGTATGTLKINGKPGSIQDFKKESGFVPQLDTVHTDLTVP